MFDRIADTFWWVTPKALIGTTLAIIAAAAAGALYFGHPFIAEAIAFLDVIAGVSAYFIARTVELADALMRKQVQLERAQADVSRSEKERERLRARCLDLERILSKYRETQQSRPSFDKETQFKSGYGADPEPDGFWDTLGGAFSGLFRGMRPGRGGKPEEFVFVDINDIFGTMFGDQARAGGFTFGGGTFGQGPGGPTNGGRPGETRLYEVLGVERTDSAEKIKAAHRKLAMKWHPDRHMNDPAPEKAAAEAKFVEIQRAYDIVGDDDKRALYNRYGEAAFQTK